MAKGIKKASSIINTAANQKAPAYLKGLRPTTPEEMIKQAGVNHSLKALMSQKFALWAQFAGIEVDGHKFDFDSHRYLLPIYMDDHKDVVWMKAAQLGATIYMLLRLLWMCRYMSIKAALYFPTGEGVEVLSKDRLSPLIKANAELYDNLSDAVDTQGLKQIHNIEGRVSSLYMLYVGGRASKDSVPLDVLAFDEVRLIDPRDIDQCIERIAHSTHKYKIMMSTAGLPNVDIHRRYLEGTQHIWTVKCNCLHGFVPSETFPDCIVEHRGEVYLRCPKCKYRIHDAQYGGYVARNPGADIHSYSVSQLISKYITPKELWEHYKRTTHMREFYNAKLGMPYVDEESRPVSVDVFNKCENMDIKWGREAHNKKGRNPRAMGVDHGAGYCYAVIMERAKDGKKRLVHLELIESTNPSYYKTNETTGELGPTTPFKRLYELMEEYNVQMCVVDAMPNINEAYEFGRHFPRKVFLAHYKDAGQDMVLWTDRTKTKEAIRKGSKEIKYKWQVLLKRYDAMDYALRMYSEGMVEIPPIRGLKQRCRNESTGTLETELLCERFRDHLGRLVREEESLDKEGENTGRYKHKWVYMGSDPHFAHANLYCMVALERLKNRAIFSV